MRQLSVVAAILGSLVVFVAALACLASPLLANPGPESAQVLAVVGGVMLGLIQAARSAPRSERGALDDIWGGVLLSFAFIACFALMATFGAWLKPTCHATSGYLPYFIDALPVLWLHIAMGTLVGRFIRRPGLAVMVMLGFDVVLATMLFVHFYRDPSFSIVSHFFVIIEADLSRGVPFGRASVAFRAGTLMFALAGFAALGARYPRLRRSGLSTPMVSSVPLVVAAAICMVFGVVAQQKGKAWLPPDHNTLEARYALVKRRGPLVVHADPRVVRPRDVDALLAEGNLWLERLAPRMGIQAEGDIHIFAHASSDERARYTGARHVDFALPWRREIHLSNLEVPHRSLGHELVHVLAGQLSDNLLRTPGPVFFMSQAAVTEGVAVALTPELATRDGLTPREVAAAMKKSGHAPSTESLFRGVSFFLEPPSRAYAAAGGVIETLLAKRLGDATATLATLYRTGDIVEAAGGEEAYARLIQLHDQALEETPLPPDAVFVARQRFKAPSILEETCTKEDADRADAITVASRMGKVDDALALAAALGDVTPATLEDLFVDAVNNRDRDAMLRIGEKLVDAAGSERDGGAYFEVYGDALWRNGMRRDAVATWTRAPLSERPFDSQRTLLAKRLLAEAALSHGNDDTSLSSRALDVLVRGEQRGAAFLSLASAVGTVTPETPAIQALAHYILGRRMVQVGAVHDGAALLRTALDLRSPEAPTATEAPEAVAVAEAETAAPQAAPPAADTPAPAPVTSSPVLPVAFHEQAYLALGTGLLRQGHAEEAAALLFRAAEAANRKASRVLLRDRAERAQRAKAAPAAITSTVDSDPTWADRLLLGADEAGEW